MLAFERMREQGSAWLKEAKQAWNGLDDGEKEHWRCAERSLAARHPDLVDNIIDTIRSNPTKSYEQIAADIGNACSGSTIQRFLACHESYSTYVERILPLLTKAQKVKHVAFANHFRNRWGLPPSKYLLIHYDEKWFYGWVGRANAKKCEQLGLEKNVSFIYHKSHVNKVMVVAFTGYAFENSIENGGEGVKLGMYRVQAARIAKRQVKASRRRDDGSLVYDGPVVRDKGEAYMVDTTVTGADAGTSDAPKFSLKQLFESAVFPEVAKIVGPDGAYEGYIPVFQGDNAGPHQDGAFFQYCTSICEEQGWHWEPQAPQMPFMNNLDLAIFPAMSKKHGEVLRNYSSKVAPEDDIYTAAETVWKDLPSSKIARGFVLAYRLAELVVKHSGDSSFLCDESMHRSVRNDFYSTDKGIKPKTIVI